MHPPRSILFVYNAGSEALTRMNDPLMKTAASGSERCNLHTITYSPVGMKKEWRRCIHDLGIPARFLSREEFASEFPAIRTEFPVAFFLDGDVLKVLLAPEEINGCKEVGELAGLLRVRVAGISG